MNNYYFDYSSSYLMKMSSISRPVPQGPPHQQQPLLLSDHFSTHVTLPHCVTVVTVVTDGVQAGQQQPAPVLLGLSSHHSCLSWPQSSSTTLKIWIINNYQQQVLSLLAPVRWTSTWNCKMLEWTSYKLSDKVIFQITFVTRIVVTNVTWPEFYRATNASPSLSPETEKC